MTAKLVISALSTDRPGLVDKLSNIIYNHALNIEDSRMTVLGGEFAILLLVAGEPSSLAALQSQQGEIEQALNMSLLIKPTTASDTTDNIVRYSVNVTALDNPGIVHNITSFFSKRDINIINLQTERYFAPHTGSPMFALHMTIGISAEFDIAELRDTFLDACDELNLDAELEKS